MNPKAVIKLAKTNSSSLILSANIVLLSNNIRHRVQKKRALALSHHLQLTAEVADATAGLTNVIVEVIDQPN
ncbi:MAG TPA: hypothetical protein PLY04_00835 [bacterium]|nr:hypothetical protein [bacterium]